MAHLLPANILIYAHRKYILISKAEKLIPKVRSASLSISQNRSIPESLIDELVGNDMFRLLLPKRFNGQQLDLLEYLEIIQGFAQADGSTGWCLNQNNVLSTFAGVMPKPLADEIWSDKRSILANGPPVWFEIKKSKGGYKLSGEWRLSSGFSHANWLLALVSENDTAQTLPSTKTAQYMVIPKSQIEPIYDWNVNGLRGTGSNSFKADNLFVPENRTFKDSDAGKVTEAFNGINRSILFASGFAFVALGIARASLDETFKIARKKRPQGKSLLRDQELIQNQIGQAEAIWRSSKALLVESITDLIESAETDRGPAVDDRIAVRLASTHAIRSAAHVVDSTYDICGSHAVYNSNPIHIRFQDIHALTQQIQGRVEHYSTAGQHLLGIKTESPFF